MLQAYDKVFGSWSNFFKVVLAAFIGGAANSVVTVSVAGTTPTYKQLGAAALIGGILAVAYLLKTPPPSTTIEPKE
jgi:hypothetical protein